MSFTQATQPEVANYITDIFGADSDDEAEASNAPPLKPQTSNFQGDDDDAELQDSDDDAPTQKSNRPKSASQSQSRADSDDNIEDSDEDNAVKSQKKKKTLKKKRKDTRSDSGGKEDASKIKKRRQSSSSSSSKKPTGVDEKGDEAERNSGDEYDSGDDIQRTAADDRFIDEDDDLAGVAGEYDAEEQVFDDERPDDYDKKKAKTGRGSAGGSGGGGSRKSSDPFTETLDSMQKPKAVLMSEAEKDKITERLLQRMHEAWVKDEALFKQGEPAVNKLQLLKSVQQVVAVKALQHNLLEKDILGSFKDWIEPKRDASKTLPSLTVRTAVYNMLAKLPCQTDHLKRTEGDKKPIGYTILALRKHKMETPENKRALKELMEKWCRPVFRKVGHLFFWIAIIFIFIIWFAIIFISIIPTVIGSSGLLLPLFLFPLSSSSSFSLKI